MSYPTSLHLPKAPCLSVLHSFSGSPLRAAASRRFTVMAAATDRRTKKEAIEKVKEELTAHIHETRCHPIVVRLAWHDAGSYDKVRPH